MRNYRKAIEKLYIGTCEVITRGKTINDTTKVTEWTESILHSGVPCRLSFSGGAPAGSDIVATVAQQPVLFLAPETNIPNGSKINVTQNGVTTAYCRSGEPRMHEGHQEIDLALFERWA